MKKTRLFVFISTLYCVLPSAVASPVPGCAVLTPPGDWGILWSAGGDKSVAFGNGSYALQSAGLQSAGPASVESDPTGEWDWLETYTSGELRLTNSPDFFWYSSGDANNTLCVAITKVMLKVRSTRYQATNPSSTYLEFEVTAQAGSFFCIATYAGSPSITNVPETADQLACIIATAQLQQARLLVLPQLQIAKSVPSQVMLSWPTNFIGFSLESAETMTGEIWNNVTNSPTIIMSDRFCVAVPASEPTHFFRLRLQ